MFFVLILNNKMLFLYNYVIENKRLNNNTIFLIIKQNVIKLNIIEKNYFKFLIDVIFLNFIHRKDIKNIDSISYFH